MAKQAIPIREDGFVVHPHVVLLGAGASFAACPNGDRNGRKIPLLKDLPEILALEGRLEAAGFTLPIADFEETFTTICERSRHADLRAEIENRVFNYFSELELPVEPNVYDHLVSGLRPKDVIATFNWDSFLIQAMLRNKAFKTGPQFLFLHGNVLVAHCMEDRVTGFPGNTCSKCGKPLTQSKLLYPVGKKNYAEDGFIASQWDQLKRHLGFAYGFTIFGYSGPKTDAEARSLMANEWVSSPIYRQSEVEIIDILDRDELEKRWEDIIFSHHSRVAHDFSRSLIFNHPRRSTEALYDSLLMCNPRREEPFPKVKSIDQISSFIEPLVREEQEGRRNIGA